MTHLGLCSLASASSLGVQVIGYDKDKKKWETKFNVNDYKVWAGDDIGKKFKGTITSFELFHSISSSTK